MKPFKKKPSVKPASLLASLKTRSFRVGGYSVAVILIVVAIAVAVNALVSALPANWTQLDTTASQLFTISEETETILDNLEQDVTIYWVVQSGQEDDTLSTLLDRYAGMSSKVKVVKKDPDVYPTFVEQYVSGSIYNNSLIVESETRHTYVSYEDIYTYDYTDYYSYDVSFAGESALTGAIDYVTRESLPRMYTLTGHGEQTLSSSFQSAVEGQNIELESLSLLTADAIPEDADVILIYAPEKDLSDREKTILLEYLQSGGSLILITDPLQEGSSRPNLEALMGEYGLKSESGIVVEGSKNHYAFSSPVGLLPDYGSHEITSPLQEGGYYVYLPVAQGLTADSECRDTLSITQLLTTSSSAYSKVKGYGMETYEKEEGDIDGPFALAMAVSEVLDDGGETNLVWVSSSYLLDDQTNNQVSGGNQDFFLNCISWMCQQDSDLTIHAKTLSQEYLTVSSSASSLLTLLMVGVIPLGCLAAGIVIWVRRKKR